MKNEVVFSHTYSPEDEALRLKSMLPRQRHENMLEQHRQDRATKRENHKRGVHRLRFPAGSLK